MVTGSDCPSVPGISMALVLQQMTPFISTSWSKNGTNSLQAFSRSRVIAGHCRPHSPEN
jgi:hypothetical protein